MMNDLPLVYSKKVARARRNHQAVLALESAVITHGLPWPQNLELARTLESEVCQVGVTPATIALLEGEVRIGLEDDELERLATHPARKVSRRDLGITLARKQNGGTTVAATLIAARLAGIQVFSTGGIGGVHREPAYDISADLPELGRSRLVVVCAGAKAILNLAATVEYLEMAGVPILGYRTNDLPAFYSVSSGLRVDERVESPEEIAGIARMHWRLPETGALLVVVPPPAEMAVLAEKIEAELAIALKEARELGIRGAGTTPFLLGRLAERTGGESLRANLALLRQNVLVGAEIALALRKLDPVQNG